MNQTTPPSASSDLPDAQHIRDFLLGWQRTLCSQLEALEAKLYPGHEPARFCFDEWQRKPSNPASGAAEQRQKQEQGQEREQGQAQGLEQRQQERGQAPGESRNSGASAVSSSASLGSASLSGGGISAVLRGGRLWEQAGVNFSHVCGSSLPAAASASRPHLAGRAFEAMGVSIVIHPLNPYVPTTHANIRFFVATAPAAPSASPSPAADASPVPTATAATAATATHTHTAPTGAAPSSAADTAASAPVGWFGGGFDLTPYYGFEPDAQHWHRTAKAACEPFGDTLYPQFKNWCDRYFHLPHRGEQRGIGGLFFDDYTAGGDMKAAFAFARSVAEHFFAAYAPIVERHALTPFGERERQWQLYRRGRYVEFNLVYDRGTLFGLQSGGRTESILMSMPPLVRWQYGHEPQPGSPEADLLQTYLHPRDWL